MISLKLSTRTKLLLIISINFVIFIFITNFTKIRENNIIYFSIVALLIVSLIYWLSQLLNKHSNVITKTNKKNEGNTQPSRQPKNKPENKSDNFVANNIINFDDEKIQADKVTSLPNKFFFNEILNRSISHAKRNHSILSVLIIDIDYINPKKLTLTTEINNYVNNEICNRLKNSLRQEDILSKLANDEFIVLLTDIKKPKFSSTVAEKLIKCCSQPINFNDDEISISASIGISIYPDDGDSLESLIKNANDALYQAKHSGKGSYHFCNQAINIEALKYAKLRQSLHKAIKNNEFVLFYQPKQSLKKGNIVGLEALIRWEHPEHGMVDPGIFLPIAEETGLMTPISEWVIHEVCKKNRFWQTEGYQHVTIAINLSPQQLYHPNLQTIITHALNETGLNPEYLEFEISESTLMADLEASLTVLNSLKTLGVQFSLDHFGTGHTSIKQLKQLPLYAVKIDKSYIKGVPDHPDDNVITSAMIALIHELGIEVVAEGVETAAQLEFLWKHHCDLVQGYFLSHPVPADKIVLQLKKLSDEVMFNSL